MDVAGKKGVLELLDQVGMYGLFSFGCFCQDHGYRYLMVRAPFGKHCANAGKVYNRAIMLSIVFQKGYIYVKY